jgi:hypothetical protein
MGSQRLVGENIEYIENNDSHPGAQFDPQFRDLAKTEVAKLADEDRPQVARAKMAKPVVLAQLQPDRLAPQHSALAAKDHLKIALAQTPKAPKLAKTEDVAQETPQQQQGELLAFAALPVRCLLGKSSPSDN